MQLEFHVESEETDNDNKGTDVLDTLDVNLLREQIAALNGANGEEWEEITNLAADMLEHAKVQNELYLQDFQDT